jgi:hypothetical protein
MSDEYKKGLQEQFAHYVEKIEKIRDSSHWHAVPSDAFYYKMSIGRIKQNTDDVEWLEYAIGKLEYTLALAEKHIEREQFKQLKGLDLMEKIKRI